MFGDKLLVFSLDVGFSEPMIQILKESYSVDEFPAIVVEDEAFEGLVRREELVEELCEYYGEGSFDVC